MSLRKIITERAFNDEPKRLLAEEDATMADQAVDALPDEMGDSNKPESEKLDFDALEKALMDGQIKADEAKDGVISSIVEIIKALNKDAFMKVLEMLPEETKAMMKEQLSSEDMEAETAGEESTETATGEEV